ncbi:MAG: asparagine synthase (glutamine-hydrolyzing), partial [Gammaproteobacteria bacterium]
MEQIKTRAAAALKSLRHRGPDDSGLSLKKTWAMGHTRLSIIDLAASRQPMRDPSGRYYLAFNGEIYNFRSLRDALKHQWQFTTNGDTEVVLAGLAIQGEKFLPKMEGMWAIALWDDEKKNLFLSRDRMGKKPLYFQAADGAFACASELPALRHIALGPPEEDMDSTADYLTYGYPLPGTTAYKGIREVLPGHMLSWRPGADISQRPYWSLYPSRFSGTFSQATQKLRENLIQAVEARLVADVEVGAFLSGGVDSSLVVGILTKELGISPKTFTIGFSDAAFDERGYARKTANSFATQHFERTLDHWDQNRLTDLIVKHVGQPFSDSSILPTACVSELASEHVKVALSGDGGDELFSGYQRYHARTLLRWYTRLPKYARSSLQHAIRAVPEPMAHHSRSLLKKAHLFVDIVERHHDETPYIAPRSYSRARFAVLAPDLVGKG